MFNYISETLNNKIMARKKKIDASAIIDHYMKQVLENGKKPESIYLFAKEIGVKEIEVYSYFASFESIEKEIFKAFFANAKRLLDQNKDFITYSPQDKLLAFYYTFFEVLKVNRSFVINTLSIKKNGLKSLMSLTELRKSFFAFIEEIEIETYDLQEDTLERLQERGIEEWAWGQLLFTLKFWMDDESPDFEKTDLFIEKSITTSFALMDTDTLSKVVDLGKFLFKEKMKMG